MGTQQCFGRDNREVAMKRRGSRKAATNDKADHDDLVQRVRAELADEPSVNEVRMFGGIAFMVGKKMLVHARGNGDLLARVDPVRSDDLLTRPGASQAEMGEGRSMGDGWITVDSGVLDDATLREWIAEASAFHRTL